MATLKAMFKLFDGYSSTIDKINRKTDEATNKIMNASGVTDKFNKKLENTGASASAASSGLGKLIKSFVGLAAVKKGIEIIKKGIEITDEFTNTAARLALINDGLQEQTELQDKIFAAANRSRGAYGDMADAIAKMGLMARDAFSVDGKLNTDELVAFTELVQKSFKIAGADTSEQQGAMRQLAQAMASGRLQGDELVSIMENAPMIYDAIAKYMGKTKAELKELSSKGAITSDIIKNAMFKAADNINKKFDTMPMTFADIWTRMKNEALKAFQPIIEATNRLINSEAFNSIVNGIIVGINLLTRGVSALIDLIVAAWPIIQPILIAIGIFLLYQLIGYLTAAIPILMTNVALWWSMNAPIVAVIATIAGIIYILQSMGVTFEDVFGFIGGVVGVAIAGIWNLFIGLFELILGVVNALFNPFVEFGNFLSNVFINPVSSVIYLFQGLADSVLGVLQKIASAMDFVFGSNMADTVAGWRSGLKDMADAAVAKYAPNENYQKIMDNLDLSASDFGLKRMNYTDSWSKGQSIGKDIYGGLTDAISSLTDSLSGIGTGTDYDISQFGTPNNPLTVEGKGNNKKIDVDMSDEDLKYLRDIAERDYINKFSTATLAPNIQISFGDVHQEADANKVAGRIRKILQEEIAMAAEGAYT